MGTANHWLLMEKRGRWRDSKCIIEQRSVHYSWVFGPSEKRPWEGGALLPRMHTSNCNWEIQLMLFPQTLGIEPKNIIRYCGTI
jgi:hypothetical protein